MKIETRIKAGTGAGSPASLFALGGSENVAIDPLVDARAKQRSFELCVQRGAARRRQARRSAGAAFLVSAVVVAAIVALALETS